MDPSTSLRIGQGFDVHAFAEGRPLIIGGVRIPHDRGLAGHSDADVLTHAVMDALLGAAALGDLGHHFPDTDPQYRDADSLDLLARVVKLLAARGLAPINVDATLIAEEPKFAPYIEPMRLNLSRALGLDINRVSIKATTTERLGFTGRSEGIAAMAITLVDAISP